MPASSAKDLRTMSSIELIAIAGFSLCIGWLLLSFFWLFCEFPVGVPASVSDATQLALFVGIAAGYVIQHFLGKRPTFNLFSSGSLCVVFLCSIFQPLVVLAMLNDVFIPLPAACVANLLAGFGASALITAWLDVLSRLKRTAYARFTGAGIVIGALLVFVAVSAPANMQPMFAAIYVVCTVGLVLFASHRADGNEDRAPLDQVADPWMFTKEIEPSFFVFNAVFALDFVFLFNSGREYVLWGMVAIIPGALVIALMGILRKSFSVTILQRVLLVLTVIGCVLLPFVDGWLQLACACLVVAAWAAFMAANYAFIVIKCMTNKAAPLFRQAPARLSIPAWGFVIGWALATIATASFGEHDDAFTIIHLVMTVLLVITVMVFFPVGSHHPAGGGAAEELKIGGPVVSIQMDESQLLDRKCQAIVELYQLSPREADILVFLAKGRNAAWIQEQLVISPHTVKSHIYNIYRKLDIHSQQKLMSFVEEYPLDLSAK